MKSLIILVILLFSFSITFAQYGIGQKDPSDKSGQVKANKGQYEETNSNKEHPYSVFVKTKIDFNLLTEINYIEQIVLERTNRLRPFYTSVFKSALSSFDPTDTAQIGGHIKYKTWGWDSKKNKDTIIEIDKRKGVSESSIMCKNAAFVYLMGFNQYGRMIRGTGNPLDRDTLKSTHTNLEYTNI